MRAIKVTSVAAQLHVQQRRCFRSLHVLPACSTVARPRVALYVGAFVNRPSLKGWQALQYAPPQKIIPDFSRGTLARVRKGSRLFDHAVRLHYITLHYFEGFWVDWVRD